MAIGSRATFAYTIYDYYYKYWLLDVKKQKEFG
jgi:hypothetical protein